MKSLITPPKNKNPDNDFFVKPNDVFRKWVEDTFHVTIPETAAEIVKHPTEMDDDTDEDEFLSWLRKV